MQFRIYISSTFQCICKLVDICIILQFVLKFWNLTCWYLRHYSNILRAPPSWMDIGTGSYPPFSKMAAKIWNSHKATQIFFHYWRNHGMWPIISRYFNPIKRIEMIEIHFDTPYSLWGPPRIQDGRHILEMKNDGMWYIFSKYFRCLEESK